MEKIKVYLAGQPNKYERNWKNEFSSIESCEFFDWEIHSNQTSPDTFFPDDLQAIKASNYLIANPGIAPSEATWMEIGAFYGYNSEPGEFCNKLIIIWKDERNPKWSIEFVKKAGYVVSTVGEAKHKLLSLIGN